MLAIEAGYSASEIGVLTALSAVTQMGSRLALGRVMRICPDWVLIAAASSILAVSSLLVALSAALVPFLVAQLLQGVARACFWTGSQTHVVRGAGSSVRALARINLVSNTGLLLGPLAAGVLAERSVAGALAVGAAVAALGVIPAYLLDRLPPFVPPADRPPGQIWSRPGVAVGCWAGVTAGAWRGLLGSYVPVALVAAGHVSTSVGGLVALANAASLVGAYVVGRLGPRGLVLAFGWGTLVTGAAVALVGIAADSFAVAALALVASGLGAGAIQTLGPAIASDAVHPQERGEAIAATGTFRAASLFAAPMVVAGAISIVPLAAALAGVGVVIALPAIYAPRLRHYLAAADGR